MKQIDKVENEYHAYICVDIDIELSWNPSTKGSIEFYDILHFNILNNTVWHYLAMHWLQLFLSILLLDQTVATIKKLKYDSLNLGNGELSIL